ncbi:MAG TPA: hypothetical protein VHU19_03935 [Pyrinomonadaceae bacterium]|jgi:hypothetical protein|nr:hypothetical protein [Pyrinomonadaceae bacterium]
MTLRPSLALPVLLALLMCANVAAQLPQLSQESKEEKEKAQKELERKALSLLDDTLQSAQALKLAENRAVIRAQAADLLWKRDEKRARSLFRDAVLDLAAALGGENAAKRDRSYWMLVQLRPLLLQMIAARDAQFALDLLRESHPASGDDAGAGSGMAYEELRLEQSIAAQAAENDPKAALKMAEESLDKGVTYGLMSVLERLRQKDAEAATRLAGEIVEKLQGESLAPDREATQVAVSLLHTALLPQASQEYFYGATSGNRSAEKPKPLVMEDDDVRDLAELVSSAALKDSNGMYGGLLMQISPLLPELEKRVPARAAQLRLKIAEMEKTLDPNARAGMQFDSLMREGSPDAILEAAAKAPAEMRQNYYTYAAMKLIQSGDAERARQVVNDNLRGQQREQMLAQVDGAAVSRAVEKGNLDEARAVVSRIQSKERRAGALAQLATAFASKGDRKGAAQLLDEARGLVSRQPDNEKETAALLELARCYALVEPSKTFEMVDPLIDQANDMIAAAALLEKFGAGQGMFRKGEMILSPGLASVNGMYSRYVKALAELARVDFDRTRSDAERFRHEEVRLMARLVIAQSILSDHLDAGGGGYGEAYAYGGGGAVLIGH